MVNESFIKKFKENGGNENVLSVVKNRENELWKIYMKNSEIFSWFTSEELKQLGIIPKNPV